MAKKIIFGILFVGLSVAYARTFAIGSPYNPGSTLDPSCSPGEINCTVSLNFLSSTDLGNVTNESKETMFTSPTFTGTVSGITPAMVGLGNVPNLSFSGINTGDQMNIIGNAGTVTNGVYTNAFNSFSVINPLTTLSESWIGPSSINGIYFKNGNIGLGTISPTEKLNVTGNGLFSGILTATSLNVTDNAAIGGTLNVTGNITGNLIGNATSVTNGVYTNAFNSFSVINPLTTLSESWIGPSSTSGIYFKDGNLGLGTITPTEKLNVIGNGLFSGILTATSLNITDKETTRANLGLTLATNDEVVSTVTTASFVTAWGDSLTASAGGVYTSTLSSILGRTVYNKGVGGQTSTQIAVRQGGVQTTATIVGGTIPASGGVTVTFPQGFEPVTSQGPTGGVLGTITGVYGTVTYSGGTYTFTRLTSGSAVSVTSAPFTIDNGTLNNGIVIIWAGRNNYSSTEQVKSDIAAMVANLGSNTNYLILSVTNGSGEPSGTTNYNTIVSLDSFLASTYSGHYLDIRSYLINHGLQDASITPTSQDQIDITNDVIPTSLRSDTQHLTTAGYNIVAKQVAKFITSNTFESETKNNHILTSSNLQSIFSSPIGIGLTNPNTGIFSSIKTNSSFYMPNTTRTSSGDILGVIYKDSNSFIHNFNYGYNGLVTTQGQNTFIGISAGNFTMGSTATQNYNSSYNTGIGYNSLFSNTTGYNNTGIGYNSLFSNTTGFFNSALGANSLFSNTTGGYNTAIGYYSLSSNTTGNENIAIGHNSLSSNTTGIQNSALGTNSLHYNITGTRNSALGTNSLSSNTTGISNTASGYNSLSSNITGNSNTASGFASLYSNTTGDNNTAVGLNSGRYITDGTTGNITGSNSVFLGYDTRVQADGQTNQIVIGAGTIGNGSNTVTLGNTSIIKTILSGSVGIGTTTPGAKLDVAGTIRQTGGVNCALSSNTNGDIICTSDANLKQNIFDYTGGLEAIMGINPSYFQYKGESYTHAGFIAQNVQQFIPEATPMQNNGYLGLDTNAILATTVNAIKEMNLKVKDLSSLDTSSSTSLGSMIKNFLADSGNSLDTVFFGEVHTKKLCLDDVCITKDQLQQLLNNTHSQVINTSTVPADTSTVEVAQKNETTTTDSSTPPTSDESGDAKATTVNSNDSSTKATTGSNANTSAADSSSSVSSQ